MTLKNLARKYEAFEGAVIFWMLPYDSLAHNVAIDEVREARALTVEGGHYQFSEADAVFLYTDKNTVDIDFDGDLTPEIEALKVYWQQRSGATLKDLQAFNLLSRDVAMVWHSAYVATRDKTFDKPAALEEPTDADPESDSALSVPEAPTMPA